MASRAGRTRSLRAGVGLCLLLALAALTAPLVATDRPWLARGPDGLSSPALRAWLGLGTSTAEVREVLLRAPVPYSPEAIDLPGHLEPPSTRHWLGTDGLGRDLAARTLHGSRVSLEVGLLAALFALLVGVPLGALAGYAGGLADAVVSRIVEAVLCIPSFLLALVLLASATGRLAALPAAVRIALVLGLTGWIPVTRFLRGEFLKLGSSDALAAARASGAGHLRLVGLHLLPAALAPVLVTAAFVVAGAMIAEATLSYLGLGAEFSTPTWGGLLRESRTHVQRAWWLALFPGLALFVTVLACNLVGEGLRDLLDPRSGRGR